MRASITDGGHTAVRATKRARFEGAARGEPAGSRTSLFIVVGLIVAATAWFGYVLGLSSARTAPADTALPPVAQTPARSSATAAPRPAPAPPARALEAKAGAYLIPVSDVTTSASYFTAEAGGKTVRLFAVRDASGAAHVALDACNTCTPNMGYTQAGDQMRCGKCGQSFPVDSLTAMGGRGGCHPISVAARREGASLVIASADVAAGARWF